MLSNPRTYSDNSLNSIFQPCSKFARLSPVDAIELADIKMKIIHVSLATGPKHWKI